MGASPGNVGAQPPHPVHLTAVSNGVAERFMRTLREQCLYVHRFRNLEEAQRVIAEFVARYNAKWLMERHGYRTPEQVRAEWSAGQEMAA